MNILVVKTGPELVEWKLKRMKQKPFLSKSLFNSAPSAFPPHSLVCTPCLTPELKSSFECTFLKLLFTMNTLSLLVVKENFETFILQEIAHYLSEMHQMKLFTN